MCEDSRVKIQLLFQTVMAGQETAEGPREEGVDATPGGSDNSDGSGPESESWAASVGGEPLADNSGTEAEEYFEIDGDNNNGE
jgi:hypothetical protein